MPPVVDPENLYSEMGANRFSPAVAGALYRVYVPDRISGDVTVIDPALMKVVGRFRTGVNPQHVVPAWDLKTLWVVNNAENRVNGSVTPINPQTAKPGRSISVDDPYNMYFTPDGQSAIVVAEESERLDFRDPHSMALQWSLPTPGCAGINHADFSIDGRYALFTCEYAGGIAKIDLVKREVVGYLALSKDAKESKAGVTPASFTPAAFTDAETGFPLCAANGMPQDIRISPDGRVFYVADMLADGVYLVDGDSFVQIGFIPTGRGAHGLYPSRDGTKLYVANRGSHRVEGKKHGMGSVSVIDFATRQVVATWHIPGGGSPDMGNVSPDGRFLWLSGRFDNVVYRFDTRSGAVNSIPVGKEPHGLAVWPQPGRYSLGHTGNMR
jgi:DNA-binding beta-propeller fold protein YncE